MEFDNINLWALLGNVFARHGPAVPAIAQSYSPQTSASIFFCSWR
jgi:hypothetical protein